jgi:hypothetical protein
MGGIRNMKNMRHLHQETEEEESDRLAGVSEQRVFTKIWNSREQKRTDGYLIIYRKFRQNS